MPSAKGRMMRLFGGLVLREARVVDAEVVAPCFRRLELEGEGLGAEPGDKLQILLPSDDVRTYSPLPTKKGVTLLGWRHHAGGPGARWFFEVQVGATVRCLGAQRSLALPTGPVIIVGDETSVAVAAGLEGARPRQVLAVFAARVPDAVRFVAQGLGLSPTHVALQGDVAAVAEAVVAARRAEPTAAIALTGGSPLITAVRAALRAQGIRDVTAKAYWVPGRVGID